jgi:hypothetical protein
MSDDKTISQEELSRSFQLRPTVTEEDRLAHAQTVTIHKLMEENKRLKAEVEHLHMLLASTAPLVGGDPALDVSDEEAICEIQLRKLQAKAQDRELTLEETKRLEILIKSLYLIREKAQPKSNDDLIKLPKGMTADDLAKLASAPDSEE